MAENGLSMDEFLPEETEAVFRKLLTGISAVIFPSTYNPCDELLRKLLCELKIPWICYNSGALQEGALSFVGSDYVKSGRIAMGLAALLAGERARVLVLSIGVDSTESYLQRMQGFCQEGKEKYPEIRIAEILEIPWEEQAQRQDLQQALEKHPDINLVYIINPGDYSVCDRLEELAPDRRLPVLTYDLTQKSAEKLKEGKITAIMTQQPEVQGELTLELIYRYLAFGEAPEKVNYTKQEIYIAQNL